MIIDLDEIFEDRLSRLENLNNTIFSEVGKILPIAVILSVSDGEDPRFEGVPSGEVVDFTVPLEDLMGGDPYAMIIELMRGVQYRSGKSDFLNPQLQEEIDSVIKLHPVSPEQGARDMLDILLEQTGVHQKEILIMGLQRLIRDLDSIGVLLSMDSFYKKVAGDVSDVDLSAMDLSQDDEATDAHVLHMYAPSYHRVVTKPYQVKDGKLAFSEEDCMDLNSGDRDTHQVASRFSQLFESVEAN